MQEDQSLVELLGVASLSGRLLFKVGKNEILTEENLASVLDALRKIHKGNIGYLGGKAKKELKALEDLLAGSPTIGDLKSTLESAIGIIDRACLEMRSQVKASGVGI